MKVTRQVIDMFEYLNKLRKSGVTNMLGASPFLVDEYGIPSGEARKVLSAWMGNFTEDGYDHLLDTEI